MAASTRPECRPAPLSPKTSGAQKNRAARAGSFRAGPAADWSATPPTHDVADVTGLKTPSSSELQWQIVCPIHRCAESADLRCFSRFSRAPPHKRAVSEAPKCLPTGQRAFERAPTKAPKASAPRVPESGKPGGVGPAVSIFAAPTSRRTVLKNAAQGDGAREAVSSLLNRRHFAARRVRGRSTSCSSCFPGAGCLVRLESCTREDSIPVNRARSFRE